VAPTSAAICKWIKDNGYFPSNSYKPGTKVLYSLSYNIVDNSKGQAYGVIGNDGNFVQQGLTTMQMALCPGANGRSMQGKCNWQFNGQNGYAQLAMDTVCSRRSRSGAAIHPGYSKISANYLKSYTASTAGKTFRGGESVEVLLTSRFTNTQIVFQKNFGLVAVVYKESSAPSGTSEVFIDASGTSMLNGQSAQRE
jgi:hypothetical protein